MKSLLFPYVSQLFTTQADNIVFMSKIYKSTSDVLRLHTNSICLIEWSICCMCQKTSTQAINSFRWDSTKVAMKTDALVQASQLNKVEMSSFISCEQPLCERGQQ